MPPSLVAASPSLSRRPWSIRLSVETLLLSTSLFWALTSNGAFLSAALKERAWNEPTTWGVALALLGLLTGLHFFLVGLVAHRWIAKPLIGILLVGTALSSYFIQRYGVYLDPSMLRNTLKTNPAEAGELLNLSLLWHLLLYACLPILLLWRVTVKPRSSWWRGLGLRLLSLLLAAAVVVVSILGMFQSFSSLMRNQKEVRYLITPANGWWSLASVIHNDMKGAAKPRMAIGLDAKLGPAHATQATPRAKLLVLVVGETARGANWGLNGYTVDGAPRNTTPELARLSIVNFPKARSCGTNTEVSVPCIFAPVGRRDYDEDKIRGSESLLHVLARAGISVHWRDNQSGCKGVCEGLSNDHVKDLPGAICEGGHCLDEGLLLGLDQRLKNTAAAATTEILVLHQLGNHGPAYFKRYPPAFERFTPVCKKEDLRLCSRVEIVNAFDNALLYTDHLLAQLLKQLQSHSQNIDSAVIYVSDHGESLGENNIFLHGLPYAIAPEVQTWVPMLMWLSPGFETVSKVTNSCLQKLSTQPVSHDHLFHTVLGLMNVQTSLYEPAWDLGHSCRSPMPFFGSTPAGR